MCVAYEIQVQQNKKCFNGEVHAPVYVHLELCPSRYRKVFLFALFPLRACFTNVVHHRSNPTLSCDPDGERWNPKSGFKPSRTLGLIRFPACMIWGGTCAVPSALVVITMVTWKGNLSPLVMRNLRSLFIDPNFFRCFAFC